MSEGSAHLRVLSIKMLISSSSHSTRHETTLKILHEQIMSLRSGLQPCINQNKISLMLELSSYREEGCIGSLFQPNGIAALSSAFVEIPTSQIS